MKPTLFLSMCLIIVIVGSFFISNSVFPGTGSEVVYAQDGLPNPLGEGNSDPRAIIGNVINAILGITGSLALLVFILGGLTWVTSAGNEEKIRKGKDMIMWAALGLFIIFASYALVRFVIITATGTGGTIQGSGQVQES